MKRCACWNTASLALETVNRRFYALTRAIFPENWSFPRKQHRGWPIRMVPLKSWTWGLGRMSPRAWTSGQSGIVAYPPEHTRKWGCRAQERREAGRLAATSVCTAAGCPRSTAFSNSKACWLREVRNESWAASERELPVGTAAFSIRLAHQLSPCKKTPTSAPPGTWQTAVCGPVYASHHGRPRAQRRVWSFSGHGCQVGSAWTFRQFHIQASVRPQQRGYRYTEARTLRAVFRVFFCNACAYSKKDSGLLLLTGKSWETSFCLTWETGQCFQSQGVTSWGRSRRKMWERKQKNVEKRQIGQRLHQPGLL